MLAFNSKSQDCDKHVCVQARTKLSRVIVAGWGCHLIFDWRGKPCKSVNNAGEVSSDNFC